MGLVPILRARFTVSSIKRDDGEKSLRRPQKALGGALGPLRPPDLEEHTTIQNTKLHSIPPGRRIQGSPRTLGDQDERPMGSAARVVLERKL